MATNKLYNQGNYNYGDLLINSSLNINVKTSSLIAVNLINILVEKYGNLGSEELDSNTTPSYMKDFLSKYFNKYIYNRFYEVLSNNVISSPYGNDEYYKNENALWCYYYQRNQNNFISFYYDYNDNYKNQQIRLQPLYYTGNGNDTSKSLQILNVSSNIDDNIIMGNANINTSFLKHKKQFDNDVVVGNATNSQITSDGYNSTAIIPNIIVDKYGHVKNFTNYTIKTPSWSDCAKILYRAERLMGSDAIYVNLNDTINNFAMIVFNFKFLYIGTYYCYNDASIISIPIYSKNIQYIRNVDHYTSVNTGFQDSTTFREEVLNSMPLGVAKNNNAGTQLILKLINYGEGMNDGDGLNKVWLESIVGYVVG